VIIVKISIRLVNLVKPGRDKFVLEIPNGILIDEAMKHVINKRPEMKENQNYIILINKSLVVSNQKLEDNDSITIFPPFMGG